MKQHIDRLLNNLGIPPSLFLVILFVSLSGFFLLLGYECVRSISSSLLISEFGSKDRPIILGGMMFFALLCVYIFNLILSKYGPRKTIILTCLTSMGVFLICIFLAIYKVPSYSVILYYTSEIYIVLIIEQFWSLANSVLSTNQSKKLSGFFIGVSSIGAILGGTIVINLTRLIGTEKLLLFPILFFIPIMIGVHYGYKHAPQKRLTVDFYKGDKFGLQVIQKSRYLLYLVLLVAITQILAATLTLNFYDMVQTEFTLKDDRTIYIGRVFLTINCIALILNFIGTPLAFKYLGLKRVHLLIPLVHMILALWMFKDAALIVSASSLIAFKFFDYSLFRAGKEILYIPLNFNERFRAKQFVDTFIYRSSKGTVQLVFGFLGYTIVGSMLNMYLFVALLCVSIWIVLILIILKRYDEKEGL